MSAPARRRLMRDSKRLQQDPPAGISVAAQGTLSCFGSRSGLLIEKQAKAPIAAALEGQGWRAV
ncbi:hypothetical protein MANES_09G137450v8 [Manihot esculenta]|uniref:Uncharacterized protein n=1 Tax=Manihot esculenta TaxID=3983 RepID=A0ACB7H6F8_MANES|nr:hypothetical protein MANES_09G137450v8 [Manihot esculenta]